MTSLIAFEAAARTGSFGGAASRVALTQSAVSRAIATLEESLGVTLFQRDGRRVQLTEVGRAYADQIGVALDQIRRATAGTIEARNAPAPIAIATLPSFGMRWLAPRLPRLFARHPDLAVSFSTRVAPFDFARETFDAAIHFGEPDWVGAAAELLIYESMVPVCSPRIAHDKKLRTPADLRQHTLLEQSTRPDAATPEIRAFHDARARCCSRRRHRAAAALSGGGRACGWHASLPLRHRTAQPAGLLHRLPLRPHGQSVVRDVP
jgi:LysR family transcriptional regulator, glycine cleavage system transcriptional activator